MGSQWIQLCAEPGRMGPCVRVLHIAGSTGIPLIPPPGRGPQWDSARIEPTSGFGLRFNSRTPISQLPPPAAARPEADLRTLACLWECAN